MAPSVCTELMKVSVIEVTVTYWMTNACAVSLIQWPFAEGLACVRETAYFMQWAHSHEGANELHKTKQVDQGILDFFSTLVRGNNGIMNAIETYWNQQHKWWNYDSGWARPNLTIVKSSLMNLILYKWQ